MAKSTGLAVFALIIGAGGLGLGAFTMVNFQVIEGPQGPPGQDGVDAVSGISNTWFDFLDSSVVTNPASVWVQVDQLLINFTVNSGESAIFLFSTVATIQTTSFIELRFALDGVRLSDPLHPYWTFQTTGTLMQAPVSFHHMLETISVGPHNLSIHITGNHISNQISSSTLLVHTINS